MATALWLRTIRHHRIDRQAVEPCTRDNPHDALEEEVFAGCVFRFGGF